MLCCALLADELELERLCACYNTRDSDNVSYVTTGDALNDSGIDDDALNRVESGSAKGIGQFSCAPMYKCLPLLNLAHPIVNQYLYRSLRYASLVDMEAVIFLIPRRACCAGFSSTARPTT